VPHRPQSSSLTDEGLRLFVRCVGTTVVLLLAANEPLVRMQPEQLLC
jgi:hypothetical protein